MALREDGLVEDDFSQFRLIERVSQQGDAPSAVSVVADYIGV